MVPRTKPEKNMKATEDFFTIVLHAHIISAAHTLLSTTSNLHTTISLAQAIVDSFVDIDICDDNLPSKDDVYEYTREMLTLLLILENYHDAVREGDGDRVMLIWKILMLVFKATKRTNYAKEAAILLLQRHCLLSERKAAQLVWSRFVNTSGFTGHNIPTDLHIEHLNRRLKGILRQSGSNIIQPNSIVRASKAVGFVNQVCTTFELECGLKIPYGQHKKIAFAKEVRVIADCLQEKQAFTMKDYQRCHHTFSKKQRRLITSLQPKEIESWLVQNIVPTLIFM